MKHKHHHKKLVSITLFIVGILLLVFSINSMHKIAVRKSFTEIEVPANELQTVREQRRSAEYDTLVVLSLIAGVVLTVSGASSLIFYRSKR
ncbi:MAG TPA: hypothetical protein VLG44_07780 [Chlamydiales bacterium]|nr:hypothetical protein [Chlamydiales bacterium]